MTRTPVAEKPADGAATNNSVKVRTSKRILLVATEAKQPTPDKASPKKCKQTISSSQEAAQTATPSKRKLPTDPKPEWKIVVKNSFDPRHEMPAVWPFDLHDWTGAGSTSYNGLKYKRLKCKVCRVEATAKPAIEDAVADDEMVLRLVGKGTTCTPVGQKKQDDCSSPKPKKSKTTRSTALAAPSVNTVGESETEVHVNGSTAAPVRTDGQQGRDDATRQSNPTDDVQEAKQEEDVHGDGYGLLYSQDCSRTAAIARQQMTKWLRLHHEDIQASADASQKATHEKMLQLMETHRSMKNEMVVLKQRLEELSSGVVNSMQQMDKIAALEKTLKDLTAREAQGQLKCYERGMDAIKAQLASLQNII